MTVPRFPEELPCPLRTGAPLAYGDNRRRTSAEQGVPRFRRGASLAGDSYAFSLHCTIGEAERFDRFFIEETGRGALPFIIADPQRDGRQMFTEAGDWLLKEDGTPLLVTSDWLVMFDGLPQRAAVGNKIRIGFSVAVMP